MTARGMACKLYDIGLLHPTINFLSHTSLLHRLCLLLCLLEHCLQLFPWHPDIWQSHEHVEGVGDSGSLIACLAFLYLLLHLLLCSGFFIQNHLVTCMCRGCDTTRVEDVFPSRGNLIFQCLGAEMVKYSASVDGVEEDGRGPLRSIRNSEWRTQRECAVAKRISFVRLEEMCCIPFFCWWCSGIDVACLHGKVGRLLIGAIRL